MWYRYYIWKMPKTTYNKINNMSVDEMIKKYSSDEEYLGLYEIIKKEWQIIMELWSDIPFINRIKKDWFKWKINKFFANAEYDQTILYKDDIKWLIDYYRNETYNYYKKLESADIETQKSYFHSMVSEWDSKFITPYNLDNSHNKSIVNSRKYEYIIFDLVKEYRLISENDILILYWW